MQDYRELNIYKIGYEIVLETYKFTSSFPQDETFGLTNQIRRSTVSIISNIAEGRGRMSDKEFSKFLKISLGSTFELECQLKLAEDLKYLNEEKYKEMSNQLDVLKKSIYNFILKLK